MDNDWALVYPGCELQFGRIATTGYGFTKDPEIDGFDLRVEDENRVDADGLVFGRDFIGGRVITFDLLTKPGSDAALQDAFEAAWRADSIRDVPGAVATLRASSGRIAFGRPRRVVVQDRLFTLGRSRILAQFITQDGSWYGGPMSSSAQLVSTAIGAGLSAPLTAPLVAVGESISHAMVQIGGRIRTPIWVKFNGPLVNGSAEIGDLLVQLNGSIPEGQSVTVDARSLTARFSGGGASGSAAGMLSAHSTSLTELLLPPGQHSLVLRGTSSTGTASVDVGWRDAFTNY